MESLVRPMPCRTITVSDGGTLAESSERLEWLAAKSMSNPMSVAGRFTALRWHFGTFLPAIAPGLSVGVQSGWTEAPTAGGRAAIDRLAVTDPARLALWAPVSRPSDGIRASVTAGLRLFSGGAFIGATRKVDQAAPWTLLVTFGQQW